MGLRFTGEEEFVPGVTLAQAQAEMSAAWSLLHHDKPSGCEAMARLDIIAADCVGKRMWFVRLLWRRRMHVLRIW